jgi:outer membrane lipoprotein SlyB
MNKQKTSLLAFGILLLLVLPFSVAELISVGDGSSGSIVVDGGNSGITVGPVYEEPCGNGIVDLSLGEECDGLNLGGATCSVGYSGLPTCRGVSAGANKCLVDYSSCTLITDGGTDGGSNGGSGGGSSGGSGGGATCLENWTCSEWNTCSSGTQTRTCSDSRKCGTVKLKPLTSRECSVEGEAGDQGIGAPEVNSGNGFFGGLAGITGAVIGGGAGSWIAAIIFILIIAGILFWVLVARKKKKTTSSDVKVKKN